MFFFLNEEGRGKGKKKGKVEERKMEKGRKKRQRGGMRKSERGENKKQNLKNCGPPYYLCISQPLTCISRISGKSGKKCRN